jgi:hypothetical protein
VLWGGRVSRVALQTPQPAFRRSFDRLQYTGRIQDMAKSGKVHVHHMKCCITHIPSHSFDRRFRIYEISDFGETIRTYKRTEKDEILDEMVLAGTGAPEYKGN